MATKTVIHRFSDISGDALEASVKSASFSIDGATFEIDLTNAELTDFHKTFAPYIKVARQVAGRSRAHRPRPKKSDLDKIREWASANGYTVASRGRIAQKVIEAYDAAQAS